MSTTKTQSAVANPKAEGRDGPRKAQPLLGQRGREIQPYGALTRLPIGTPLTTVKEVLGDARSPFAFRDHRCQSGVDTRVMVCDVPIDASIAFEARVRVELRFSEEHLSDVAVTKTRTLFGFHL